MDIRIRGAREHNLKGVDIDLHSGLTVVTGVSGSGKSSLVFDTLHHEVHRRFLETFGRPGRSGFGDRGCSYGYIRVYGSL